MGHLHLSPPIAHVSFLSFYSVLNGVRTGKEFRIHFRSIWIVEGKCVCLGPSSISIMHGKGCQRGKVHTMRVPETIFKLLIISFFRDWKSCAFNWRQMVRFTFLLSSAACAGKSFFTFHKTGKLAPQLVRNERSPFRWQKASKQLTVVWAPWRWRTIEMQKARIIMLKWFRDPCNGKCVANK